MSKVEEKNDKIDKEFFEENKIKKSMLKRIFDIVFWIVIIILLFVWIFDFVNAQNEKEPKFCLKTVEHRYDDGTVEECVGLGYKVYNYNRTSLNIKSQFAPFFIGMQE